MNDLGENAVFQLPAADLLVVLGGNDHCVHGHRLAVLIFYRHLTFAVGSEPRQRSILPYLGQAAGQPVGQRDRQGHQFWGLVTGIAEHHALIAGTVGSFDRLSAGFQRVVHAHGDIGTLGMNGGQYGAAVAVEAKIAAGVANVPDHLPGNFVDGYIGRSGDLAHHLHQAGGGAGLTGHAGHGVFGEDRVQHRVADLVAELVRMPFGDGFTGENGTHENDLLRFLWVQRMTTERDARAVFPTKTRPLQSGREKDCIYDLICQRLHAAGIATSLAQVGGFHRARPSTTLHKVFSCYGQYNRGGRRVSIGIGGGMSSS